MKQEQCPICGYWQIVLQFCPSCGYKFVVTYPLSNPYFPNVRVVVYTYCGTCKSYHEVGIPCPEPFGYSYTTVSYK